MTMMATWSRMRLRREARTQSDGPAVCRRADLSPMWESVADMGRSDRITRYKCVSCQQIMPAAQAQPSRRAGNRVAV